MTNRNPASAGTWLARLWELVPTRRLGVALALLTFIAVMLYVFVFTPYDTYLFSDMARFWRSAMNRLNGETYRDSQFIAWPPLYHIMLAEIYYALRLFGLDQLIRLETALTINIAAFAVSVYAFQRLLLRWFTNPALVLTVLLLYAFGFPSFYFNAFLLSGNLGAPMMVVAIALLVCRPGWRTLLASAVLFGAVAAIRPSFAPYGLAFVALLLARHGFNRGFILRAGAFTAAFFAVVLLASLEVSRISQGRVFGLSANGGLDFFIANADYHRVELLYDGWHFFVIVPALSLKPENGTYRTKVPFYEQGHYFKLGWEHIKRNPAHLLTNFGHVRNLFFARMLPSMPSAPGFTLLMPIWDWFKFGMLLTLGLYAWTWRAMGDTERPVFWMMLSLIGVTALTSFIFTGEPRYTYSILFAFYLLSFKLIEILRNDWHRWRRALVLYLGLLIAGSAVTTAATVALTPDYPPRIALTVETVDTPGGGATQFYELGRALFPYQDSGQLRHADRNLPALTRPARLHQHTRMEVLDADGIQLSFEVCSSWPFRLLIDGEPWLQTRETSYFSENLVTVKLTPGVHDIELVVDYEPRHGGIAASYSYMEGDWRERATLGVDTPKLRFLPPAPIATDSPR